MKPYSLATAEVVFANAVFSLVQMEITVNGEPKTILAGSTVAQFLEELDIRPGRVVIELNREIVSRQAYGSVLLKDGDMLEIVHFVGGG